MSSTTLSREEAQERVGRAPTFVLHDIVGGWRRKGEAAVLTSAAHLELVRRHACLDCGAPAGRECKPDYGCNAFSRQPSGLPTHEHIDRMGRCAVCGERVDPA